MYMVSELASKKIKKISTLGAEIFLLCVLLGENVHTSSGYHELSPGVSVVIRECEFCQSPHDHEYHHSQLEQHDNKFQRKAQNFHSFFLFIG